MKHQYQRHVEIKIFTMKGNAQGRNNRGVSPTTRADQVLQAANTTFYYALGKAENKHQWREFMRNLTNITILSHVIATREIR